MDPAQQKAPYSMGGTNQQQGTQQQGRGQQLGQQGRSPPGGGGFGSFDSGSLLQKVTQATTIERGLETLRTGIADQIAQNLGGALDDPGGGQANGPGGATGKLELTREAVTNLNQLYIGLTTDNEAWAEALIANTPMAETADQSADQTASRAAMA